jgi:hypothetical protein
MVRQSGTYARYCLLSSQRRFFALRVGIGFHYKELEAYVFVFHRSAFIIPSAQTQDTRRFQWPCEPHSRHPIPQRGGCLRSGYHTRSKYVSRQQSLLWNCPSPLHARHFAGSFHYCIQLAGYVHMWILSAGLHLSIANPATEDIPQHDLESRILTLSGVDHIPDRLTYK